MKKFFAEHDITTLDILYNNAFFYGGHAICGTRGWFYEEDAAGTHTGKMLAREALRLEASLKAAEGKPSTAFCTIRPSIRLQVSRDARSFSTNTRSSAAITGICTATRTAARSRGCAKKTEYGADRGGLCRLSACKNLQLRHKLMQKRVEILRKLWYNSTLQKHHYLMLNGGKRNHDCQKC